MLMAVCPGIKRDGTRCTTVVSGSQMHCYQHDPACSAKRKQDAAKAGRRRGRKGRLQAEIHMVKDRLGSLAEAALAGEIDAHTAAVVTQVYNCRLRAIDLGMKVEEFEEMAVKLQAIEEHQQRWSDARSNAE